MKIQVLDHGYVKFIEAWGNGSQEFSIAKLATSADKIDFECGIIEAARQSTQGSFRGWEPVADPKCVEDWRTKHLISGKHQPNCCCQPGDAKLLQFLYTHKHFTPFEFSGLIIEVQAPIFVFREWHRHRTQSYNEMSARYAPLPDLYYQPESENLRLRAAEALVTANKQSGSKVEGFRDDNLITWNNQLLQFYQEAERLYKWGLEIGVPKEIARCPMPVGHYSRMRASANLRNWLQFMTLRCAPEAQWEIRQFANAVAEIISKVFPRTFNLWNQLKEPNET